MERNKETDHPVNEKIDASSNDELRDWSDKLGVTKVKLKAAINAVGASVKDVQAYLKNR